MIVLETRNYRIEKHRNTPLPFAVDRKERDGKNTHLINLGWFETFDKAVHAMNFDFLGIDLEYE